MSLQHLNISYNPDMPFDPGRHDRRSLRAPGFDYAAKGAYFVTICTYDRETLFGVVEQGEMILNEFGGIARKQWFETAILCPYVRLAREDFVVMPNHIHGVIQILDVATVGARRRRAPTVERFGKPVAGSVPTIVRAYKSAVTYQINGRRDTRNAAVWQRNYFEHVIRDMDDWDRIRNYIESNPMNWAQDDNHPEKMK